jgi:hypothetical protein
MASAGEAVGASCWVQVSPLAMLAQVGAVREGVGRGASMTAATRHACSTGLRPQKGRQEGGAGEVMPCPHWCAVTPDPSVGEGWGQVLLTLHTTQPPDRGWGRSEGGELKSDRSL